MPMIKIQFYLESEQKKFLKKLAKQKKMSVSALVRDTIERHIALLEIASDKTPRKLPSFIGIGSSGITDGSVNHDKYVGDAVAAEHNIL